MLAIHGSSVTSLRQSPSPLKCKRDPSRRCTIQPISKQQSHSSRQHVLDDQNDCRQSIERPSCRLCNLPTTRCSRSVRPFVCQAVIVASSDAHANACTAPTSSSGLPPMTCSYLDGGLSAFNDSAEQDSSQPDVPPSSAARTPHSSSGGTSTDTDSISGSITTLPGAPDAPKDSVPDTGKPEASVQRYVP